MSRTRPINLSANLSVTVVTHSAKSLLGWKRVFRVSDKANRSYVDIEFIEILPLIRSLSEELQKTIMRGEL